MTADPVLFTLLMVILTLATVLILSSSLMLGRKLADLGYQKAAGLNGVRRIQSYINVRTHANRVWLALSGAIIAILLIVDIPPWWRAVVVLTLFASALGAYCASSILDWFDDDAQMRLLLKEEGTGHGHVLGHPSDYAATPSPSHRDADPSLP